MPTLNAFSKLVKSDKVRFDCPHCNASVTIQEFENHCVVKHELANRCVWCFGHVKLSDNKKDVDHLTECFKKFIKLQARMTTIPSFPQPERPVQFDARPMCEAGNSFGHPVHEGLPDDKTFHVSFASQGLPFQDAHLNTALASLQLYLNISDKSDWNHIMVRAPAYASLLEALENRKCFILPFSCLCDGGEGNTSLLDRQHRHLILATQPKGEFNRNVWKTINCPRKNSNIRKQPIESPMQLVNLMGHLSQRETRCEFTFQDLDDLDREGGEKHFNIATPLPAFYKLACCTKWEGGLAEYLNRKYGRANPRQLFQVAQNVGGVWGIRIRDLPGVESNAVLPVNRRFRPCPHPTNFYLHLLNGRKMYFEESEKASEEKDWESEQASGGNKFFDCVGDEIWFPTPFQQRCIDMAKPLAEQLANANFAAERAEKELDESEGIRLAMKSKNESLKRKLENSREEYKKLQDKHIVLLERENDVLRSEMFKRAKTE